jgi:23S rRNA maturation mini-RNase III
MVGNNYMFSDVLDFFKKYFHKNDIQIKSINSNWLKSLDIKTDVCYDLAYHHIYIHYKIFGKMFTNMEITKVSDKTKNIILSFGKKKSSITVSHNTNHKFYRNDFNIETNIGTFHMFEKNNIINLYDPAENLLCSSDSGLYNELKLFSKFMDNEYEYNNLIDKNIVKWLEKYSTHKKKRFLKS